MLFGGPSPQGIEGQYQCDINEPISLYDGDGVLTCGGQTYTGRCEIRFVWMPNEGPEIVFHAPILNLDEGALRIPAIALKARVTGRKARWGTQEPTFVGILQDDVTMGPGTGLSRVIFHVANFPFVFGAQIQRGQRFVRGRIHLESTPWKIDIDRVADEHDFGIPDLPERLREARGFAITHVGELTRTDGASFDASQADEVLRDVGQGVRPIDKPLPEAERSRVAEPISSDPFRLEPTCSADVLFMLPSVHARWRGSRPRVLNAHGSFLARSVGANYM